MRIVFLSIWWTTWLTKSIVCDEETTTLTTTTSKTSKTTATTTGVIQELTDYNDTLDYDDTVKVQTEFDMAVAIKQHIDQHGSTLPPPKYQDCIYTETNSFIELIRKSKMFVDTSLFIEKVLRHGYSYILMTGPRKWGKSINLDMLRTFLEIQVNTNGKPLRRNGTSNFKLFARGEVTLENGQREKLHSPLLISQRTHLMENSQGTTPVIYVNLQNVTGDDYKTLKDNIQFALNLAFHRHEYLMNKLHKFIHEGNVGKTHYKWTHNKFKTHMLHKIRAFDANSLLFLSEVLFKHFDKKCYLIIDGFDAPVRNALCNENFPESDIPAVLKVLQLLAERSFRQNDYIRGGIIAATFHPGIQNFFPEGRKRDSHDITAENDLWYDYFGFNNETLHVLMETHQISDHLLNNIHQWYTGRTSIFTSRPFYNPYSIVKYLKHQKLQTYWNSDESIPYISEVFKRHPSIRESILFLISNGTVPVQAPIMISEGELSALKQLLKPNLPGPPNAKIFFSYLWIEGYLKAIDNEVAKLPNKEIANQMSTWLVDFYKQEYKLVENLVQCVATNLLQFIRTDLADPSMLEASLSNLCKDNPNFVQGTHESVRSSNRNFLHTVFTCLALRMQSISEFELDAYYNPSEGADVIMIDNRFNYGIVFETKCAEDPVTDNLYRFVTNYTRIIDSFDSIKIAKFVGIKISSSKVVKVLAKSKNLT